MSAHTQGEWIARPDPNGTQSDWCIGLNDDVSPVDYIAVCHERDAHLIAAAPKLLMALNAALMALIGYLPAHRNTVTDAAIESARAAIAAATGTGAK